MKNGRFTSTSKLSRKAFALIEAARNENIDKARDLIERGQSVNVDNVGWTPIMWAVYTDNIEMISLLLKHKARVDYYNQDRNTAFHFCISNHACKLLLEHGASVNVSNSTGITPLMQAVKLDADMVTFLLVRGARVKQSCNMG